MSTTHEDISDLLSVAGDDQGRPLSFAMDDVVRQGRRRRRVRRVGGTLLAVVSAVALVAGATAWGDVLHPAAEPATASAPAEPPVIEAGTWTEVADGAWMTISTEPAGATGLHRARWQISFSERPGPHDPEASASVFVFTGTNLDVGWQYPATFHKLGEDVARPGAYQVAFVRGDVRSARFTTVRQQAPVRHPAKVFRLAPMPGWVLAVAPIAPPIAPSSTGVLPTPDFEAFDAAGRLVVRCSAPAAANRPFCDR